MVIHAVTARRRRLPLEVETLEDRTTPAVFTVTDQAMLAAAIFLSNVDGQDNTIRLGRDITLGGAALPAFTVNGGHPVTLDGAGHTLQRIGPVAFRDLENDGANLTIRGLSVQGGIATKDGGGGIFNRSGNLFLDRDSVVGNAAVGNTVGGGIYNFSGAVLTIRNSVIAGNTSATFGGGMRNVGLVLSISGSTFYNNVAATDGGGGICNFFGGVIEQIVNCTFTNNSAIRGGAICNHGLVSLLNCTLVGNQAALSGGGLENDNVVPALVNTIIAGDVAGDLFPNAPIIDLNNVIGVPPRVGRLANNGGPTPTLALLPGSPALGRGTLINAPRVDQRGFPRPADGPIDVGAFQATRG
jgi:fibronectin-binding autotransporter adhesin